MDQPRGCAYAAMASRWRVRVCGSCVETLASHPIVMSTAPWPKTLSHAARQRLDCVERFCAAFAWLQTLVFGQGDRGGALVPAARGVETRSTPSTLSPTESSPFPRRRTPALVFPDDPSPEELLQYWTLSERDSAEVRRCRGEAQRRRFAVQLCALRA